MQHVQGGSYDPETIEALKCALDEAWASLSADKQALTSKTVLAERILKLAANGERDPIRLRMAALIEVAVANA